MKVLVLGATGLLGREVMQVLKDRGIRALGAARRPLSQRSILTITYIANGCVTLTLSIFTRRVVRGGPYF